ncbi:MAG: hypothetical protein KAS63_11080 [Candidatus Heimdallarchaeota archaeon]|nr:hypothetical protein [Candidatus Heimdallarchaeota archaeon]MCK4955900.1 hypothetical protein [Candidatus Heimdallarchaeota archaeon]
MENRFDINDFVDKVVENLENALTKLGKNLDDQQEYDDEIQGNSIEEKSIKEPFPSIKYPVEYRIREVISSERNDEISEKRIFEKHLQLKKQDIFLKTKRIFEENNSIIEESSDLDISRNDSSFQDIGQINEESEDIRFIDIKREIRMLHLYGRPSSGKTTLAIQAAIESIPRNTYYLITSHSTSVLKRMKLMISDKRWSENKDIKKYIFPIFTQNPEDLEDQIDKLKRLDSEEIGLVIIDHVTDYIRGEIYKEERKNQLRLLLEKLYLLTEEKSCKVLLVNGFSYKDSAPAEDIIESFSDMTIKAENDGKNSKLFFEEETIPILFNDSGMKNIHLNIYF